MTKHRVVAVLLLFGLCLTALLLASTPAGSRRISLAALEDKIRGGMGRTDDRRIVWCAD